MATLSLEALDLVSGGMDVRTLQTHLGGAGHSTSGGPGFAPLLPHGDPAAGLDPSLGAGAPLGGLDPQAHGVGYQTALAAAPEHHSTFAEDLRAITGVIGAFAGIIGQFSGHGAAASETAPPATNTARSTNQEQPDQADPSASLAPVAHAADDVSDATEPPAAVTHAPTDPGGHTNFRETATGFERT